MNFGRKHVVRSTSRQAKGPKVAGTDATHASVAL